MSTEEFARVGSKISPAVLEFCRAQGVTPFHMAELVAHVKTRVGIAPDSPSRILRGLRQTGALQYTVLNRRDSLYRIDSIQGDV